ncbi:PrgI family protein [Enterocloster clostridioformis]|nr:PrgI family protein [Lachnoclostridium sp. YL32]NDO28204.1 PrgI family protein [Enterocloster clostridioformis]OXE70653.1 PrgI family protein [Enterocloster clostridioformis]QQR00803.1 PrgI family protein [Enterocloster clostridioformis]
MEIELSEDLQHYKESLVLGLTAKQFIFSVLALGVGTGIVLLLYERIGITLSCYVATPFVVPLALTGFYNYHGLTFWQFARKMHYFSFFNRPLVYSSTESVQELKQIYMEIRQEEEKEEQQKRKEQKKVRKGGDIKMMKKKAVRMGIVTVVLITLGTAAAVWYKMYR